MEVHINARSTALLVMDCQVSIMNRVAPPEREKVLSNIVKAISASRKARMPVIYVVVQLRKDYPDVSANNTFFRNLKQTGQLQEQSPDARICDEIRPQDGDVIVTKRRFSAFTGSDLEVVLRSMNINTLVLTGVSTLGVVESTARFAFDMDYQIFVLRDCCTDRDTEVIDIAMTKVLPRVSTVCSTQDFSVAISEQ